MAETIDDELLVGQFNRGDKSAFNRIVERYTADVAALANRLLGWPGDVEDVCQDVFLSAFLGLKRFRGDCSLKSWLFTITINKCRSHRHKRKLRRLKAISMWRGHPALVPFRWQAYREQSRGDTNGTQGRNSLATNDIGTRPLPTGKEEAAMNAEDFQRVRRAVVKLPTKYREPIVLRYLQELPTEEIARILGVSKGALHVRLSRARNILKKNLAELIE